MALVRRWQGARSRVVVPALIEATDYERRRMEMLRVLCRGITVAMRDAGVPAALKGGTALALLYGLPRPSTDADWEGDRAVRPRSLVEGAFAGDARWRVGRVDWNWLWRGSVGFRVVDRESGLLIGSKLDYRVTGTMPGMPERVPKDRVRTINGIDSYEIGTLASRKLQTVIGEKPRGLPRDWYDAAWLVQRYPEAVSREDASKLVVLRNGLDRESVRELRLAFLRDDVMRRSSFDEVMEAVASGASRIVRGVEEESRGVAVPLRVPARERRVRSSRAGLGEDEDQDQDQGVDGGGRRRR